MKTTIVGVIAILTTIGAAAADEPFELNAEQLDGVTAGSWVVDILPYMEQRNVHSSAPGGVMEVSTGVGSITFNWDEWRFVFDMPPSGPGAR